MADDQDDSTDLRASLIEVAKKAASKKGEAVADLLRRDHSRRYLLKAAKNLAPGVSDDAIREVIDALRRESRDATSPLREPVIDPDVKRRPPSRGREPVDSPVWDERIGQLMAVWFVHPMQVRMHKELLTESREKLGKHWTKDFTFAVLLAAWDRLVLGPIDIGRARGRAVPVQWARFGVAAHYDEQIYKLTKHIGRTHARSDTTIESGTRRGPRVVVYTFAADGSIVEKEDPDSTDHEAHRVRPDPG